MKAGRSLTTKIVLLVEALLLFSAALFCGISIYRSRVGVRGAIQQRMVDIANCAAGSVNGAILKNLQPGDEGTEGYRAVYDTMAIFRDNVELEYIYAIRDEGNGRFTFIVDTDPDDPGTFGEEVKYTEALNRAAGGTTSVDEVPYSDKWGSFYSAYSPVFDNGEVAGIVAADFSVEWFDSQLREQTISTVKRSGVILLVTLLAAAVLCRVALRPYMRIQEQLLKEKVTAESANQAKSDFLANMSHEIRTPINALLGMNEMIMRESRQGMELPAGHTEEVRNAFDQIGIHAHEVERAGRSLLSIVNDILDFSRIEAGRMELAEERYQLRSMLNDIGSMIRIRAREKGLKYISDADESIPDSLIGDEVRIREVIMNLLNNAVKYTEHGFIRFSARAGERTGDTVQLIFTVEDSGIGIRREDLNILFDKFQRLDMKQNSTVEGSGLGLAITRSLLDIMGGTISVQSEYGKGSSFTVKIPQRTAPADGTEGRSLQETKVPDGEAYREAFHAPEARLLIVDDTKINLTVTAGLLRQTEVKIDAALSGAEAIELAKKNAYDAVFMDQRMPEMDGTETLRRIRQLKNNPNSGIPVICLTADAIVGARERYLAEGFTDYLTKPVNSRRLEGVLLKYLPKEKIIPVSGTDTNRSGNEQPARTESGDARVLLRGAGVDPDTGLMYCQGDESLYRSLLADYLQQYLKKAEAMKRYSGLRDWENYGILVHSLKSSSKMIGAQALSEAAARLEAAAGSGDERTILREHGPMINRYETVIRAIRSIIHEPEYGSEEVLEFAPAEDEQDAGQ